MQGPEVTVGRDRLVDDERVGRHGLEQRVHGGHRIHRDGVVAGAGVGVLTGQLLAPPGRVDGRGHGLGVGAAGDERDEGLDGGTKVADDAQPSRVVAAELVGVGRDVQEVDRLGHGRPGV